MSVHGRGRWCLLQAGKAGKAKGCSVNHGPERRESENALLKWQSAKSCSFKHGTEGRDLTCIIEVAKLLKSCSLHLGTERENWETPFFKSSHMGGVAELHVLLCTHIHGFVRWADARAHHRACRSKFGITPGVSEDPRLGGAVIKWKASGPHMVRCGWGMVAVRGHCHMCTKTLEGARAHTHTHARAHMHAENSILGHVDMCVRP